MRVPAALREFGGDRPMLAVDLREDATVADLLDAIAATHPALERRVRDEQGALRIHVNVFVGEENIRGLTGVDTVLRARDEISIVPAISGG